MFWITEIEICGFKGNIIRFLPNITPPVITGMYLIL